MSSILFAIQAIKWVRVCVYPLLCIHLPTNRAGIGMEHKEVERNIMAARVVHNQECPP
jgi:hypothetical protein